MTFPEGLPATTENIVKAKSIVNTFKINGMTNIFEALKVALHLCDLKHKSKQFDKQPLVIFLTDGSANVGESKSENIISKVLKEKTFFSEKSKQISFFYL